MIAIILIWFVILKRSVIEGMWIAFVVLLTISGTWGMALRFIVDAAFDNVILTVALFMLFAKVIAKTGVLDDILDIMIGLVGRFAGGAAYASIVASGFMATMSGSITANVASTGPITIPAMIRSGLKPPLAASIEIAGSTVGPIMPPSAFIIISFAFLNDMFPYTYDFSLFWTFAYYIFGVYFLHRIITAFILIKKNKVTPMDPSEIPNLREALKRGWKSILLPFVVFLPFFINNTFGDTFVVHFLGPAGAAAFSRNLIIIAPALAIVYVLLITKDKKTIRPVPLVNIMQSATTTVAPIILLMVGGYALSELFAEVGVMEAMKNDLYYLNIPMWAAVILVPLGLALIACFFDGLAVLTLLGPLVMTIMTTSGVGPWMAAAMMPAVIHSMGHLTPPYAPGIMIASSIAKARFIDTCKYMVIWITGHYIVSLLLYFGIIPNVMGIF